MAESHTDYSLDDVLLNRKITTYRNIQNNPEKLRGHE
jgi:hypothetical protein